MPKIALVYPQGEWDENYARKNRLATETRGVLMHITKLKKLRFDEDTGSLKIAGANGFGKDKTVYIDIENSELFLNAIKSAFQKSGKNIEVNPD